MALQEKDLKAYYTITEVSKMFDIPETTLRFWEKHFPTLQPRKTGNNKRQYSQKDLEQLRLIHNLVKVRGFKLEAARKMLHANPAGVDKRATVIERLQKIRAELNELKHSLDILT